MYSSVGPVVLQDLHYLAVVRGGSWGPGAPPESIVIYFIFSVGRSSQFKVRIFYEK